MNSRVFGFVPVLCAGVALSADCAYVMFLPVPCAGVALMLRVLTLCYGKKGNVIPYHT